MVWPCKNSRPPPYRPWPTPAAGPSWSNSATATARSPNSPASCASASRRSRAPCAARASRAGRQPTVGARHLYRLRSDGAGAVRGYIQRVPEDATTGHRLAAANTSRPQPDHLPGCLDAVDLAGPPAHRRLRTGRSAQLSPRQHAMDCWAQTWRSASSWPRGGCHAPSSCLVVTRARGAAVMIGDLGLDRCRADDRDPVVLGRRRRAGLVFHGARGGRWTGLRWRR